MEHHKTLSPSSFPMLELCPCYQSGESGEAAHRGTLQHKYLECLFLAKENQEEKAKKLGLTQDEIQAVHWAYDYAMDIVSNAGGNRSEIKIETKVTICDNEMNEITFGHIDIAFRNMIFDYKSGQDHGYAAQMSAYALGYMQENGLDEVQVIELYGRTEEAKISTVKLEDAENRFADMLGIVEDQDKQPLRNRFCKWCSKETSCQAVLGPVSAISKSVVKEQNQIEKLTQLAGMPIKEIIPEDFSFLIPIAEVIENWCKSIKAQAKVHLVKGEKIPGYKLKEISGRSSVSDTKKACELMNLPLEDFLSICTVSISNLVNAWSKHKGLKKTQAKKEIEKMLCDVIKKGSPSKTYAEDK